MQGVFEFPVELVESQARPPVRAVFSSALFHFAVLLFIVRMPFDALFQKTPVPRRAATETVYDLRKLFLPDYLPDFRPKGPGGRPGRGIKPDNPVALGSKHYHPRVTMVSNPPRPDNTLQTIIQPATPPELRIPFHLDVPNVLASTRLAPKPPRPNLAAAKPHAPKTTAEQLRALAAPRVQAELPFDLPPLSAQNPRLPVPLPSAALAPAQPRQANTNGTAPGTDQAGQEDGSNLLILNALPGGASDLLRLVPGNRYGSFTISPDGGWPGSPGGVRGGDLLGGGGGEGTGGDGSSGVGAGGTGGGGGGQAGRNLPVSVTGGSGPGGAGGLGALEAVVRPGQVFPVLSPLRLPRNAFLVSTGPIGGGGLRVYGVLRGNKIYTNFIPMPGKNWVLQYCARDNPSPKPLAKDHGVEASRFDQSVAAPEVLEKFDFHRFPVPPDKANELIVLHGVMREDGSLEDLEVQRGLLTEMDRAALAAFRQWKFKPALRQGKPTAIEILVGIPAVVPQP